MRTAVANSGLDCDAGRLALTVSVGFYIFHPQGVADECLAAIARADAALYAAKTVGRDAVVDAVELEQAAVPPG
jgi:PleD family two-component response regulator